MNLWKAIKRKFTPSTSLLDGLNSIKKKFGNVEEMVYQEPGLRYYKIKGTDDLLEVGIKDYQLTPKMNIRSFGIKRLIPSNITHAAYQKKVGEMGLISTSRHTNVTNKHFATITDTTPERLANKFAPGGISKEHIVNGKSYFAPISNCRGKGSSITRIYH